MQLSTEPRPRTVTYIMGSDRKGWRACFKGQGAVPMGLVTWDVVDPQTPPAVVPPKVVRRAGPRAASTRGRVVITGFDSAWTRKNRGAIAGIVAEEGRVRLLEPRVANFPEALALIEHHALEAKLQLIAIDQPLIVTNDVGRRRVEHAVSPLLGRAGSGVQPANRGRADMFGAEAPIWEFLAKLGAELDPRQLAGAKSGRFAIEVFPALAILGLGLGVEMVGAGQRAPKYNPARKTFRIEDWSELTQRLAALAKSERVEGAHDWLRHLSTLPRPTKGQQDMLDAVICAIAGLWWWRHGPERSLVIGDLDGGYVVTPCNARVATELRADAARVACGCNGL